MRGSGFLSPQIIVNPPATLVDPGWAASVYKSKPLRSARVVKPIATVAAALVGWATVTVAQAWAPNPAAVRALAGGQPFSEVSAAQDGAGLIHAAIDIASPPKSVWLVMNDCRYIKRLITSAQSCRVLQGDAERNGWDIKETVTKGGFFIPSIHNVYRSDYQPYSLIRFHRLAGDMKIEEGEWRLEPLDGGAATRVIYVNRVAVNLFAPAFMVRAGIRKDTPKVLLNLRRESLAALSRS